MRVLLRHVAHARSGDKGNISNIAVIAYSPELFPILLEQLTAACFKDFYGGIIKGRVDRYEVHNIQALNFVAYESLGGGVTRNLCLDGYGKSLSSRILAFPISMPPSLYQSLHNWPL